MSLVSSRVALTHRATIERDVNAFGEADAYGNPLAPSWQTHLEELPCRAWAAGSVQGGGGREIADARKTVVVLDRRMVVPLGTDVTEADRVAEVTERGTVVLAGPMAIEAVLHRPDHIELVLVTRKA